MSAKFPTKAPTYTTEKLSKTRVAIYQDGVYLCQLQPKEVAAWVYRAEQSDKRDAENAESDLYYRVLNALEYLEARSKRIDNIEAKLQLELF